VPNCKSLLVTEPESKHVRRRELSSSFFQQGKAAKEIHAILTETLGEHVPSYVILRNCVAQFERGDFSACDAPRPGRPKTVTNPEIIDQNHKLILEDGRVSLNQ